MPRIDQFESVFKAASKDVFVFNKIDINSALLVTDLGEEDAATFAEQVKGFLSVLGSLDWTIVHGNEFSDIEELLAIVESRSPDLVCSYRNLHSKAWKYPHSIGQYIDVLTQVTKPPILLLPHPKAGHAAEHSLKDTTRVMAITDHITGDDQLINFSVSLTAPDGKLLLTHIEDEAVFEYYMRIISKIPSIDTETAEKEIRLQAEKEPKDYIRSCINVLKQNSINIEIEKIVTHGHRLADYRKLVEQHEVDLLVFNTKDDDQLAMHGMAYPLAVEIRDIPLLML